METKKKRRKQKKDAIGLTTSEKEGKGRKAVTAEIWENGKKKKSKQKREKRSR
jgi:hypothetical protein